MEPRLIMAAAVGSLMAVLIGIMVFYASREARANRRSRRRAEVRRAARSAIANSSAD